MQLQVYLTWKLVCSSVGAVAGIFNMEIGLFQCRCSCRYIYHGVWSVPVWVQLQVYSSWGLVCYSVATVVGIFTMESGLFQCRCSCRYIYHGIGLF